MMVRPAGPTWQHYQQSDGTAPARPGGTASCRQGLCLKGAGAAQRAWPDGQAASRQITMGCVKLCAPSRQAALPPGTNHSRFDPPRLQHSCLFFQAFIWSGLVAPLFRIRGIERSSSDPILSVFGALNNPPSLRLPPCYLSFRAHPARRRRSSGAADH